MCYDVNARAGLKNGFISTKWTSTACNWDKIEILIKSFDEFNNEIVYN